MFPFTLEKIKILHIAQTCDKSHPMPALHLILTPFTGHVLIIITYNLKLFTK